MCAIVSDRNKKQAVLDIFEVGYEMVQGERTLERKRTKNEIPDIEQGFCAC
jgi:hypothetical protein